VSGSGSIDVLRDGALRFTTVDDGAETDAGVPKGRRAYRVCRTGTAICSNTVTLNVK
jgi:hypothetical protein